MLLIFLHLLAELSKPQCHVFLSCDIMRNKVTRIMNTRTCWTASTVNSNPLTAKTIVCLGGMGRLGIITNRVIASFVKPWVHNSKESRRDHFINIRDRFGPREKGLI